MNRSPFVRLAQIALLVVPIGALFGCAPKFTHEHFNLIQVGVDERYDVKHLLGKPTNDLQEEWYYEDDKTYASALILFDNDGKVRGKKWFDTPTGGIPGENPNRGGSSAGAKRSERSRGHD